MIKQGRTERQTERFNMKASPEFLARLDQWRRKQPDLPNRSEAIRRLVEAGMKQGRREKRDT
jgi:metal-responsive CopG/Arc/MetJ family transcriptional regulator